jgi:hypothetical protein
MEYKKILVNQSDLSPTVVISEGREKGECLAD